MPDTNVTVRTPAAFREPIATGDHSDRTVSG
jgi:hypothetical protein